MRARTASVAGWSLLALSVVLVAATVAIAVTGPSTVVGRNPPSTPETTASAVLAMGFFGFSLVGALILSRKPDNGVGWLFAVDGALVAMNAFASAYGYRALTADPGSLPGGDVASWMNDVSYVPLFGSLTVFLFLLFPDGRLDTTAKRRVAMIGVTSVALGMVGGLLEPTLYSYPKVPNPLGLHLPSGVALAFSGAGSLGFLGALVASVTLLVRRLRRSGGRERDQIRFLVWSAVAASVLVVPAFVGIALAPSLVLSGMALLLIPTAVGVAILRHRLFDIDLVVRKTVVFGLLAAFIGLIYVGVVVGVPILVLGRGDRGFDLLPFAAAAIIALAFQPARRWAQRLATRLVYGRRATPYDVLAELAGRMAGTFDTDDLLPRIARIVAEGTGASRAVVWIRVGDQLRPGAVWPSQPEPGGPVTVAAEGLPHLPAELAVPVRHRGDLLGALSLDKPPGEPVSSTEERLLHDVASQAGLALRNVGLNEELKATIQELRASRQRLVAAQDQERRRLERDIHDGAQQQLVALTVKARLAEGMLGRDEAQVRTLLAQIREDSHESLETLRDLARGIYPPILADRGLAAALSAQARKSPLPVEVRSDGLGRFAQEVEATAYFCCLEALQNAAKYSGASAVVVALTAENGDLTFRISDDGHGFDPRQTPGGAGLQNMRDRLDSVGGRLDVRSAPGEGAVLTGHIPLADLPGS